MNSLFKSLNKKSLMDKSYIRLLEEHFERAAARANKRISPIHNMRSSKDGGYLCIHLRLAQFMNEMRSLITYMKWKPKDIKKLKFLDVGCGVGQKVFIAHLLGFDAYGLELREELLKEARSITLDLYMYKDHGLDDYFMQGDALKFKNFGASDVIYFYCPLFEDKLETRLEKNIAKQAKKGTIVIGFLPSYFGQAGCSRHKWKQIGKNIWQKQ